MKKILILFLILFSFTWIGCTNEKEETYSVVDLRNRTVEVPKEVKKVACIGASALRLYSYVGDMDLLAGVEDIEKGSNMPVRPYLFAYQDKFQTLPSLGAGGPSSSANAESILSCEPDVIFSLYDNVEQMNQLQNQIHIPVVCLSYGGSDPFSEQVYTSLSLIGKIIHQEERSNEVIAYIQSIQKDLNDRTKDIPDEEKISVYLAHNTYNGGKGSFGDSLVNYSCFREVHAKNVLSSLNLNTNNPTIEYETILSLDPSVIFIDIANIANLKNEYQEHKNIFNQLQAFKNNQIYVQMPFNQYYTNLEIALADSYYIGKVLYPEQFDDIQIEEKFDEICIKMLKKEMNYYEKTTSFYQMGFGQLDVSTLQ